MKISKNCIVVIDYLLSDEEGNLIESTYGKEPYVYIHGFHEIIPGVEEELEGHEEGEELEFTLPPEKAFGTYDPSLVEMVKRSIFPPDVEIIPGTEYITHDKEGNILTFTVKKVEGENVYCDFNHPLAGKNVKFKITIREVKRPKEEAR